MRPKARLVPRFALLVTLALSTVLTVVVFSDADADRRVERDHRSEQPADVERGLARSGEIDRLIERHFERQGRSLDPPVDDATFVRRAYLTIAGRIPTADELQAFVTNAGDDKRSDLIDLLFDSSGYVARMLPYWGDLFRAHQAPFPGVSGEPFLDRIAQFVETDESYASFVHDLLTASGPAHAPGNGATGYLMRDRGSLEDSVANTARVFLATRIECAQCHDHPEDRWTQKNFFEMAAFFGGLRYLATNRGCESVGMDSGMDTMTAAQCRAHQMVVDVTVPGIRGPGAGVYQLPSYFEGQGASPGDWVSAETLFGDDVVLTDPRSQASPDDERGRIDETVRSREAFADWLTSPDNPRFTRVIVNRLWKLVMGVGLFEPVDDLSDDTSILLPELLDTLEQFMVCLDYDVREFLRVLCHTRHFARPAVPSDEQGFGEMCSGPTVRRLTAEQLWDSMLTWVVHDVDRVVGLPRRARADDVTGRFATVKVMKADELRSRIEHQTLNFTDRDAYLVERDQRLKQRVQDFRIRRRATHAERGAEIAELEAEIEQARLEGDWALVREAQRALDAILPPLDDPWWPTDLVRACDIESPAPEGHFLRVFGQSDREQIDAACRDANVVQVLMLCNGLIEKRVLGSGDSALMEQLAYPGLSSEVVEHAYNAMLGRSPTSEELAMWCEALEDDAEMGRRDLVWTLGSSLEFLFLR